MDIKKYVDKDEHLIYEEKFGRKSILGLSEKRIVYCNRKGKMIEHVHVPVKNCLFIKAEYNRYNKVLMAFGCIFLIAGVILLFLLFLGEILFLFIALPIVILGVILFGCAFIQKGSLVINNEICIFTFKKKSAQDKIIRFINLFFKLTEKGETEQTIIHQSSSLTKVCISCGKEIGIEKRFCPHCGISQS